MEKYNIGQILTSKEDMELEGVFGKKTTVKKGNKIFIGADNFAHHLNGMLQPLGESKVEGYSVEGIAEWVYMWVSKNLPLDEFLDEYEISEKDFKEQIEDSLEELGM